MYVPGISWLCYRFCVLINIPQWQTNFCHNVDASESQRAYFHSSARFYWLTCVAYSLAT